MDPIFASVVLGFFTLVIAAVAATMAIVYRQNEIAREALGNPIKFDKAAYPIHTEMNEDTDVQPQ